MKKSIIILISFMVFVSCNNAKKEVSYAAKQTTDNQSTHPGEKLLETNCYVCHNPIASHDDRIAPPMIAVKRHYLKEGMTKEDFVSDIQKWIKNPSEDNVKMRGAVRRFGIMPKQVFPEETIRLISEYMFENEIDQPEWFEEHFNSEKGKHNKGSGK